MKILTFVIAMFASVVPTEAQAEKLAESPWVVVEHEGVTEIRQKVSNGVFGALCSTKCNFFLELDRGCMPNSQVPVLFNSRRRVGVLPSKCFVVSEDEKSGSATRLLANLRDSIPFMQAAGTEAKFSLAYPMMDNEIVVFEVDMAGSRELFSRFAKKKTAGPGPGKRI